MTSALGWHRSRVQPPEHLLPQRRIDAHGRVQHVRDRPIPGLYGAGNVIASPAGPAYFGGGTTIGMALVWGHIAGEAAGNQVQGGAVDG